FLAEQFYRLGEKDGRLSLADDSLGGCDISIEVCLIASRNRRGINLTPAVFQSTDERTSHGYRKSNVSLPQAEECRMFHESTSIEAARYRACASRIEAARYRACASRIEAARYRACASRIEAARYRACASRIEAARYRACASRIEAARYRACASRIEAARYRACASRIEAAR